MPKGQFTSEESEHRHAAIRKHSAREVQVVTDCAAIGAPDAARMMTNDAARKTVEAVDDVDSVGQAAQRRMR